MKAIFTFTVSLLLLIGTFKSLAQATAYANIYASVVAPAALNSIGDSNIGEITISQKKYSESISSITEITASGVKMEQNGMATLASFRVMDSKNTTFDITLPNEKIMVGTENSNALLVNNFTSRKAISSSTVGITSDYHIEANLYICSNQDAENSNSQNKFPVTLNYN